MRYRTKKRAPGQPLRKTAYLPKALIAHKSLSNQAFRIAAIMLAHKTSCEPTIAEAAILARVGRDGRRKSARVLTESGVLAPDGKISYSYRVVRNQYARLDPTTLMREDISDSALRVFAALSGFSDRAGFSFPKYSTIALNANVSERTVSAAMSELRALGLVSEHRQAFGSSWKFVNDAARFEDTDAPDLPTEDRQGELGHAVEIVGRDFAGRTDARSRALSDALPDHKLLYAQRVLVARYLLLFRKSSRKESTKNQVAHPDIGAVAFGHSSGQGVTQQNARDPEANIKTARMFHELHGSAAPPILATSGAEGTRAGVVSSRTALRERTPGEEHTSADDRSDCRSALLSAGGTCGLGLFKGVAPSFDAVRYVRLNRARKEIRRWSVQRSSTITSQLSAWDCNTLRALDVAAITSDKTDAFRSGYANGWSPWRWKESYSCGPDAGMEMSMKQRGHGLFKTGKLGGPGSLQSEQPHPEIMTDDQQSILFELHAELRKRFGPEIEPTLPKALSAKQRGQLKKSIQSLYGGEQITKMIRVLVWDWEEIRVSFWPRMPAQRYPNIQALVVFAEQLVQLTETGAPSTSPERRGRSGYAARYLSPGDQSGRDHGAPRPPRGISLDGL